MCVLYLSLWFVVLFSGTGGYGRKQQWENHMSPNERAVQTKRCRKGLYYVDRFGL